MNVDSSSAVEIDADLTRKQNERVFLRQRFLVFLQKTAFQPDGCPVKILLHEGNRVSGTVRGADNAFQHIQVSSLKTPSGVYPHATLRVTDIRSVQLELDSSVANPL